MIALATINRSDRAAVIACVALTLFFAACSMLAAWRQSPTIDEPICALAGYLHVNDGDFEFDADNPPLWKYWAMIPNLGRELAPENAPAGAGGAGGEQFVAATRRLFQTPGNDGDSFVNRSRAMMALLGAALVAAVARWGWQLGGATAAVVAAALVALDPNLLAHAALVKADVVVALLTVCTAWSTWSIGRRARVGNVAALCVLCAAAGSIKYNTIAAGVIALMLLTYRAFTREPWSVLGRVVTSRIGRALAVAIVALAAFVATVVIVWASYGFRFEPMGSPSVRLDLAEQVRQLDEARATLRGGTADSPLVARVALFADRHRLMPQAWLHGLVSIYRTSTTVSRQSYLLGEVSDTGWWYYFPLALLFKTPLATLATVALAIVLVLVGRKREAPDPPALAEHRWTMLCLWVPTATYALAAMAGNVNVGVRHVLPLLPPAYLAVGLTAAKWRVARPRAFRIASIVLWTGLAIETIAAFPHYLSFFNALARPHRLHLLGDSNFDWGQGLKHVARWQREHPDVPLYFGYWGTVDPAFYGIRYLDIPGGFRTPDGSPRVTLSPENPPGVLMIGATLLQGVNFPPEAREYYRPLRELPPDDVIGDSIYLYRWPRPQPPPPPPPPP